jgi:hypothetical protein
LSSFSISFALPQQQVSSTLGRDTLYHQEDGISRISVGLGGGRQTGGGVTRVG